MGTSGLGGIFASEEIRECLQGAPPQVTQVFSRQAGDEFVMPERRESTRMSVVRSLTPKSEGLGCYGHVIYVPGFGTIRLGELEISSQTRSLTMIEVDLGCPVERDMVLCAVADGTDHHHGSECARWHSSPVLVLVACRSNSGSIENEARETQALLRQERYDLALTRAGWFWRASNPAT